MSNVEHDHYPEAADNGKAMRRLELLGVNELLRDPAKRRQLFSELSDDEFTRYIGWTNSVTQKKPISYEYEDGRLPFESTPALEDKAMLMSKAYEAVRQITRDSQLDDKTALRRAGLAMAGAIGCIHPKKDGNGRTGRLMHYLIEFGTERGEAAFGDEVYAIIGKLPVYDSDNRVAIYDTVPAELTDALDNWLRNNNKEYETFSGNQRATARVLAFLDMMRGSNHVLLSADSVSMYNFAHILAEQGRVSGVELYEHMYSAYSELPNRLPSDVPFGAKRVMAQKSDPKNQFRVKADFV